MLTSEQERTLAEACALYIKARQTEDTVDSLRLFNEAFGMLAEYVDEVDNVYYHVVFANCIEEMQRKGNLEFGPVLIQAKADIYVKTLDWLLKAPASIDPEYRGHLIIALFALARLFLLGEDTVQQIDHYAYICYQCIEVLGVPEVKMLYMEDFVEDEATGLWKFTGIRPE